MICLQCNIEFIKSNNSQKYCSKKCSEVVNYEKQKKRQKKYTQSDKGKEYQKKYRQTDKYKTYQQSDKFKESVKNYKQSDKGRKANKKYRQTDAGKVVKKRASKKYYKSDKGKAAKLRANQAYEQSDLGKKYRQSDKFREAVNKRSRKRRKSDPVFKLTGDMRRRLNQFLKASNIKKTNKTFQEVGCTPEFLKKHLEKQFKPGMTWKNHTPKGWHIDHRIALSNAKSREDLERLGVAHYTNLQPMWSTENLKKSNKII